MGKKSKSGAEDKKCLEGINEVTNCDWLMMLGGGGTLGGPAGATGASDLVLKSLEEEAASLPNCHEKMVTCGVTCA